MKRIVKHIQLAAKQKVPLINRELSWLGFNERVLQEAEDPETPLIERFRFLGIFSNNADEFYRVRVASVKRLAKLSRNASKYLGIKPEQLLTQIQKTFVDQQERIEKVYKELMAEATKNGIKIIDEKQFSPEQQVEIERYFKEVVRPTLVPIILDEKKPFPELKDKDIYLAVQVDPKEGSKSKKKFHALIEIPRKEVPRFKVLKGDGGMDYVVILDDIIRAHLKDIFSIFSFKQIEAYTIKLTRDAELDVDRDDLSTSVIDQLTAGISGRKKGRAVRFVYDRTMPEDLKDYLFKKLGLHESDDAIPGGRYHNFKDFMSFPSLGTPDLQHEPLPPIKNPYLTGRSLLKAIKQKDILLHLPYQSFVSLVDIIREAAIDPNVKSIKINLYRVAKNSKIINALINAVRNGKVVTVVIELLARFDEENNINLANKFNEEGVRVIFGVPGLKVHSKLMLISRKEGSRIRNYAHVGTGNFHEGNAKVYTDTSLLTADPRISDEVEKLFEFFENNYLVKRYSHLINSPQGTRRKFVKLINEEIKNAKQGQEAEIILKLNNLVDTEMIKKLYEASCAGVKIQMIVRGICSLVPGVKGVSENIHVVSIVDRFLEHSRIMYFKAGGADLIFISSADWMTRNLDFRVEVTTPIYDEEHKRTLIDLLQIQLKGNVKARLLTEGQYNTYHRDGNAPFRSQVEIYNYLKKQAIEVGKRRR